MGRWVLRGGGGEVVGYYDDYINQMVDAMGRPTTSMPPGVDMARTQAQYRGTMPASVFNDIQGFSPTTHANPESTPFYLKLKGKNVPIEFRKAGTKYLPVDKATGRPINVKTGQLTGQVPADLRKVRRDLLVDSPGNFGEDVAKSLARGARSVQEGLRPGDRGSVPGGQPGRGGLAQNVSRADIKTLHDILKIPLLDEDQLELQKGFMPGAVEAYKKALQPVDYGAGAEMARRQFLGQGTAGIMRQFGPGGGRSSAALQALGAGQAELEAALEQQRVGGEESYRNRMLQAAQLGAGVGLQPRSQHLYQPPPPPPPPPTPQPSFGQSFGQAATSSIPTLIREFAPVVAGWVGGPAGYAGARGAMSVVDALANKGYVSRTPQAGYGSYGNYYGQR